MFKLYMGKKFNSKSMFRIFDLFGLHVPNYKGSKSNISIFQKPMAKKVKYFRVFNLNKSER